MTLGEFVKKYRDEHDKMSARAFANMVDMSPQQILNIENGIGNDKKPMTSTMKTYIKIAKGVGMDETEFMKMLNDDVIVNPADKEKPVTTMEDGQEEIYKEINNIFDQLNRKNFDFVREFALFLLQRQQSQERSPSIGGEM